MLSLSVDELYIQQINRWLKAPLMTASCQFVNTFSFCSFGMAYDFIDCIGDDVDVVSDSEVCEAVTKAVSFFVSAHVHTANIKSISATFRTSKNF